MFQPLAVRVENLHVRWLLCTSFPPPSKDLLLIEAPYQKKTEDSSFGCKTDGNGHRLLMRTTQSQCHPHHKQNLLVPSSERSKRHTSMTAFHFDISMHKTYLTEWRRCCFFFLNPILLLVPPSRTYLLPSPAHWVAFDLTVLTVFKQKPAKKHKN